MSTTTVKHEQSDWGGGTSPLGVSYGKMMMWYFLLSDAFSFAALLITYGTIRFSHPDWPNPNDVFSSVPFLGHAHLPLVFVSFMTFTLIMSSVTMVRGVQEGHRRNQKGVALWLGLTILGGLTFLGSQAWEWHHLITSGMSITSPWTHVNHETGAILYTAPKIFGQLFFTITGFHGFHVTTGVIINCVVFIQNMRGVYDKQGSYEMVEKVGLYWHFVDLVWVFVFLCFYLL